MKASVMRCMLGGQFLMMLALEMGNTWMALMIAGLEDVPASQVVFWNMLALLLPMVASMVMAPLWGYLSDRHGYRPMLMRAAMALCLSQIMMLFASSTRVILLIRLLQGLFAGFLAAMQAYALAFDNREQRGRILVRLQSARALGTGFAGVTGGALLGAGGFTLLYAAAALLCFFALGWMYMALPRVEVTRTETVERTDARGMSRMLLVSGILIILAQLIRFFPEAVFTLAMNNRMPGQYLATGLLCSLPAIGLLASTSWTGRRIDAARACPRLRRRFLLGCALLGGFSMLLQALDAGYVVSALARFSWGITLGALLPALFCEISDRAHAPGAAVGMANAFAKAGNILGVGLGGFAAGLMPLSSLFLLLALLYGLFMLIVRVGFREEKISEFSGGKEILSQ
ncbi:multidrug efflux MFS transporter [Legionella geestiana]|uniref:MFS transporter n=1 Tax=Legionella geestiana TaxID=45065 RepID=UPI0010930AF4|nr:MFS transporter [Legionella geestiana]QDQ39581.1 multidrug efflux MFS transporter [Legionella geestiana]